MKKKSEKIKVIQKFLLAEGAIYDAVVEANPNLEGEGGG